MCFCYFLKLDLIIAHVSWACQYFFYEKVKKVFFSWVLCYTLLIEK
uniref:Uncharacterized protein n=1 Tax=Siphoviridae sp. ctsTb19 TaxID=2827958 RepID=A0A8S5SSU5_9CAUD|nr:MAG TPA: hypothetical protein [Siphoviridae sp. ctsTb19]DAV06820.1 MAG TPA: hypothetical protein [Caudoviricetes sp.]